MTIVEVGMKFYKCIITFICLKRSQFRDWNLSTKCKSHHLITTSNKRDVMNKLIKLDTHIYKENIVIIKFSVVRDV